MENVEPNKANPIQISLLDLFLWVSIFCITAAGWNLFLGGRYLNSYHVVRFAPQLLACTTAWTVMVWLARRRFSHQPIDFQPGYWLLCVCGAATAYYAVFFLVEMSVKALFDGRDQARYLFWLSLAASEFTTVLVALLAGFLFPVRPMWRWVLVVPCLVKVCAIYAEHGLLFTQISSRQFWHQIVLYGTIVAIAALVAMAVGDKLTTRDRHDWVHWLGVANTALLISPPIWVEIFVTS